ncbi:hypothetical protein EAE32_06480 [Kocuria tytonicola]|uniref:Uncharacterized protein n=1 Tax=Kocuria tytonicola TaxID=2055946 RepID=A0A3L9L893_9MICC|nr:hypothetical protein [Kocuria tytonicola]RLY94781.1 hypothetical protein EAE32_06480 [Kocuria tytonicola]
MSGYTPGERREHHRTLHTAREVTADHTGHLVSVATTDRTSRGFLQAVATDGDFVRLDLQVRDGRVLPVWVQQDTAVLVHRTRQQDNRKDRT